MTENPHGRYVLDGRRPVAEPDLITWATWFETADRIVARTEHELFQVSTVFLGLDHSFGRGPPLLFETLVFLEDDETGECWRYATWDEAEAGHRRAVDDILAALKAGGAALKQNTP